MNNKFILPLIFLATLSSCSLSNPSTSIPFESESASETESMNESISESTSSELESEVESESKEEEEQTIFEKFFNIENKVELKLDFSKYPQSINKLAKYSEESFTKQEMYHPVDVTVSINNETFFFEECGARMKGNTSRNPNFVDDKGNIHALVHFKISFNQTFDDEEDNDYYIRTWESSEDRQERKDRRFGHVKKFDIKWNKSFDSSYTKQAYSYECFREEGLLVERNNLIKTTIKTSSSERTEIYLAQECIDKEFLKYHLPKDNSKGNLYKATYTSSGPADYTIDSLKRIGVEGNNFKPAYDLKTNDDEPDHTLLKNLITELNNDKSSASTFKNKLDSIVDVDSLLKYHALCFILGNPDDSRMNYNNHYVYFDSITNKASFIPYDFDRCLGILQDWDRDMTSVQPFTTKDINRSWQKNPLLWRLFLNETDNSVSYSNNYPVLSEYQEQYKQYVLEYAEKYLDVAKFQDFTNKFYHCPNKDVSIPGGNNPTNQTFAYYCKGKKQAIEDDTRM